MGRSHRDKQLEEQEQQEEEPVSTVSIAANKRKSLAGLATSLAPLCSVDDNTLANLHNTQPLHLTDDALLSMNHIIILLYIIQ